MTEWNHFFKNNLLKKILTLFSIFKEIIIKKMHLIFFLNNIKIINPNLNIIPVSVRGTNFFLSRKIFFLIENLENLIHKKSSTRNKLYSRISVNL